LYTWINHHVEAGNGPPTFFITLSCAEHHWPDVIRLVRERMEIAGDAFEECYYGSPKLSKILNEYALVVQEYFQQRVEIWLRTVGKVVFGIKHYWARYEFAPGRGQIHTHLLAITNDNSIHEQCHLDLKRENGKEIRAKRLADWAERKFGLTASVSSNFDNICTEVHPSSLPYSKANSSVDLDNLLKTCNYHECSGFCMRPVAGTKRLVI